jgi:membrane protein implicated in regulation of membrane protease activity
MTRSPATPGPVQKLLAVVAGTVLLVLGFMFSVVFLTLAVVVGLLAWAYFAWKTRELRRAMREHPAGGHVVDAEVIVVDESATTERRSLPRDPPSN